MQKPACFIKVEQLIPLNLKMLQFYRSKSVK